VCFGAMVVLHIVRTDLDPVRQVMSEYANGRFGWFMTAAFYAMGLACVALAVRLGRAIVRRRLSVALRVLLGLGGLGLILAGVSRSSVRPCPTPLRRSFTAMPR
jgi:di/tricarboxylate transporter